VNADTPYESPFSGFLENYAELESHRVQESDVQKRLPVAVVNEAGTPGPLYDGPTRQLAAGETMARYVVGFLFCNGWVLLIRKIRPDWQRGKLNGPGGKVEPGETFAEAMVREWREEVGVGEDVHAAQHRTPWVQFAKLMGVEKSGQVYEVGFFCAEQPKINGIINPHWQYEEHPQWYIANDRLPNNALPNLRFLLPMALHTPRKDWPYTIVEGGQNPQDATT